MIARNRLTALVTALAALGAATGIAACGSDDEGGGGSGEGAKIALLLPETKTTRYEKQDRPNFEKRVRELCPDCEVLYSNANQDPAKQQQQAEAAITQGAKALVIGAVDVKSASVIVERAKQSKVPVVAYGRLIADADLDYYVSIDPFKVGQQQGRALDRALEERDIADPRVVMINGAPTDSNAGPYKDGARQALEQGGAEIVRTFDTPDWSPDKAQQEMEGSITSVGEQGFDGVYVANDGMASGAIAAMKSAGISPKERPVTGQDAELAGVQRILAGEQLMTVYQPLKKIASVSAELAVPLAQGRKPPGDLATEKADNGRKQVPSALLETIEITKDNIQETLVKDGFLEAGAICTPAYEKACREAGIR